MMVTSCTEVIQFDLNTGEETLVVDGLITNEKKAHEVKLSLSTSYYYGEDPPPATGADVTISDGTNVYTLTESPTKPGSYFTDSTVQGVIGTDYILTITYNDQTYTANDTLRRIGEIDTVITFPFIDTLFTGDTTRFLVMHAQESEGRGDYYLWNYYVNGELRSKNLTEKAFGSDEFIDGATPPEGWFIYTDIPFDSIQRFDTVTLEMFSISEDYFTFVIELFQQTVFRGGFFDGPPANIKTNVSNGAVGFFRASAVRRKSTINLF